MADKAEVVRVRGGGYNNMDVFLRFRDCGPSDAAVCRDNGYGILQFFTQVDRASQRPKPNELQQEHCSSDGPGPDIADVAVVLIEPAA